MANLSEFCTCERTSCPLHPTQHDKGCAPCIGKNLRTKELPNCFFDLVKGSENRKNDYFKEFAELVLQEEKAKEENNYNKDK